MSAEAGGTEAAAEDDKATEKAACKIQAAFRGKQVRQEQGGSAAITVGVRMRPFVPHEKKRGTPTACIRIADNVLKVAPEAGLNEKDSKEGPWKFDLIMDSSESSSPSFVDNAKCYELMGRRMMDDILQGFNTCLFCYGQTGTGKTTTIMGDEHNGPGLLRRLLDDIFAAAEQARQEGATVAIDIQMLEVYNEDLHDLLLEPGQAKGKVQTQILPSGVLVKGATTKEVQSADECQKEIDFGNSNKTVAKTAMNPQSSRGHTVFKLVFRKQGGPDGRKFSSEVYFADLAGHENIKTTAVTGDRLKELTFINGSLMWLQNALHSMAEASGKKGGNSNGKADFSKFRNSKLTLLLSNALTGNSKTAVIVTLSPSMEHFDTSLSSIKFAMEVKGIKVKAVSTAGQDPQAVIAKLEAENRALKEKLAQVGGPGPGGGVQGSESAPAESVRVAAASAEPAELQQQGLREELAELAEQGQQEKSRRSEAEERARAAEEGAEKAEREKEERLQQLREKELQGRELREELAALRSSWEGEASRAKSSEQELAAQGEKLRCAEAREAQGGQELTELREVRLALGSQAAALQEETGLLKEQLAAASKRERERVSSGSGGLDTRALREEITRLGERLADAQALKEEVAGLREELAAAQQEPAARESNSLREEVTQLRTELRASALREEEHRCSQQALSLGLQAATSKPDAQATGGPGAAVEHLKKVMELSSKNLALFQQLLKDHGGGGAAGGRAAAAAAGAPTAPPAPLPSSLPSSLPIPAALSSPLS